jgi:hypothetical protein
VRENCGDRFESLDDGVILISLPIECDLALGPTVVDEAVVRTLSYNDLEIDLTQSIADIENKVLNLNNYITPTRELAAHLAELAD